MLSVLPDLFDYWMLAPVVLRAALGLSFLHEAYQIRKQNGFYSLIKLLTGLFLLVGYLMQIGALAALVISALELWRRTDKKDDRPLFKLVIAAALLLLGPGWISIDLPL